MSASSSAQSFAPASSAVQPPSGGGDAGAAAYVRLQSERDRLMRIAGAAEVLPSLLHEIRNPLAAIHSMVELLIEDHELPRLRTDLHAVLGEVRRIQTLLSGLGSMGRSLRATRAAAVDLAIEETANVLTPMAAERGVRVVADVAVMPLLPVDLAALRGVLFNLIRNAVDACRPGDRIDVVARLREDPRTLELTVRDTGQGMSPDTLQRCTELFYSTKPNGSGIGLGIVRESIEAANGKLEISSTAGEGTTIAIYLPFVPVVSPATTSAVGGTQRL